MKAHSITDTIEIKQRIMNTATVMFGKYGYTKTTIDDIAGDLSISKKTIYKHFRSKQEILFRTAAMHMNDVKIRIDTILDSPGVPALGRFFSCMGFITRKILSLGPLIRGLEQAPRDIRNAILQSRHNLIESISHRLLNEAVQEGKIRPDVDMNVFSLVLMTLIDNIFMPEIFANIQFTVTTLFQQVFGIMMSGILNHSAVEEYKKIMAQHEKEQGE